MSNFFNYMSRMKYIKRWALMRNNINESIMEHSEQVAQIAHALALISNKKFDMDIDLGKVTIMAVYHEASEVLTGDLPTPIKYHNPNIKNAYKALEKVANDRLIDMLPEEFRCDYSKIINMDEDTIEYKIVKSADKLSAYIKCIEEIQSGNCEFKKAKNAIEDDLLSSPIESVHYFMENFIPSFYKSLDELE